VKEFFVRAAGGSVFVLQIRNKLVFNHQELTKL